MTRHAETPGKASGRGVRAGVRAFVLGLLLGALAACAPHATQQQTDTTPKGPEPAATRLSEESQGDPALNQASIRANRQRIVRAASLVPDSVGQVPLENGEPSFEYINLKKSRFNTQLAMHADEIHALIAEVVSSPARIALTEDPAWHRPMTPEDAEALERCSELASSIRRLMRYFTHEAARRVRAGRPDAATDSLELVIDLSHKCSTETNAGFRLSAVGFWVLSDEDFEPVMRRLGREHRAGLARSLERFEPSDPIGLREHAFREAGISIAAFERSLATHGGTGEIARLFRISNADMFGAVREPGGTFHGKSIYVMNSLPVWANALERVSEDRAGSQLARAKELVVVLTQASTKAEVEPVLDEMIADKTLILMMLLGDLPMTLNATWKSRERFEMLRQTLLVE